MANQTTEEIKERLNIVDVLSSYIQLKKAGTNYKATCPFHHEKSASLMVSPSKQIWHCFGCGEGGDIFGFVMRYENLDFGEALKVLAEKAGVQLPKYTAANVEQDKYKQRLLHVNNLAAKFYNKVLSDSSVADKARAYIAKRQLSAESVNKWQLGFAPNDSHLLRDFMTKKGYSIKELMDSGLCSKNSRNEIYDRFFGRVMFPIENYTGDVVGFTARILDESVKAAKYINSPETPVYNKSKVIFGLYQAKQQIRKEDFAIVVEGNMDVISCHQEGITNVVGSSGTAFTYDQLQVLSRLTKNLKFAFDTDQAGMTATRRALDLALQLGFSVYVIKMEGAKDPDEALKKDKPAFLQAIKDAPLYLDYFFEKAFENYDPTQVKQKKEIMVKLVPLIQKLTDPIEHSHYVRILSQRLGVNEKTIYQVLAQNSASTRGPRSPSPARGTNSKNPEPLLKNKTDLQEQRLLGFGLYDPEYFGRISTILQPEHFKNTGIRQIYEKLLEASGPGVTFNIDGFIAGLGEFSEVAKIALFMVESEYSVSEDPAQISKEFEGILRNFKNNLIKSEMARLAGEMVLAEQKKDKARTEELNKKFLQLSKTLKD